MKIRIKTRQVIRRLEGTAPTKTIASGRIGARPPQRLSGTASGRSIRAKITQIPSRILSGRSIAPKVRTARPSAAAPIKRINEGKVRSRLPAIPPLVPKHRLEVPQHKLQRHGVPNPQSLRRGEYRERYGSPRDVSPVLPKSRPATGGVIVLLGPTPLNHEGRLRKTGKPCGHWAMYAFLLEVDGRRLLGVQFKKGFRCYYPSTNEANYHEIVNAESGSYYSWDYLRRRAYITF